MNKHSGFNTDFNLGDFANSAGSLTDGSLTDGSLTNTSFTNETLADETARLLSELDQAIDHSSALRDIIRRQEALQELESITGSSLKTQTLRLELIRLEQQLHAGRDNGAACEPSLSPA
jgi:hypothetical protein